MNKHYVMILKTIVFGGTKFREAFNTDPFNQTGMQSRTPVCVRAMVVIWSQLRSVVYVVLTVVVVVV